MAPIHKVTNGGSGRLLVSIKLAELQRKSEELQAHISKVLAQNEAACAKIIQNKRSQEEQLPCTSENVNAITATMASTVASHRHGRVGSTNGKMAQKYPLPEHLDTITINMAFTEPHITPFDMRILPDTGANVTAIDVSYTNGITLEDTSVVLRVANGTILNTLGTAECQI